jgi:hypothetical protein
MRTIASAVTSSKPKALIGLNQKVRGRLSGYRLLIRKHNTTGVEIDPNPCIVQSVEHGNPIGLHTCGKPIVSEADRPVGLGWKKRMLACNEHDTGLNVT